MVVTVSFFSYFKASATWKGMENDKYNNGRDTCLILCEVGIPTTFQRAAKVWGLGDSLTENQAAISYPFLLNHELSRSFSHFQLVTLEDYIIFWQAAKVLNARLCRIPWRQVVQDVLTLSAGQHPKPFGTYLSSVLKQPAASVGVS